MESRPPPSWDAWVARRALAAAAGLRDQARIHNQLDLRALADLLPALGLTLGPAELTHLVSLAPDVTVEELACAPWRTPRAVKQGCLWTTGAADMMDAALSLAAAHVLGRRAGQVRWTEGMDGPAVLPAWPALDSTEAGQGVLLVVGPVGLTLDLLSPAPRDLAPVVRVFAQRQGVPLPGQGTEMSYQLLEQLLSSQAELRDERADNDERAGITVEGGAVLVEVGRCDPAAVDERLRVAAQGAGADLVLAVGAEMAEAALLRLAGRIRAALVLAPSLMVGAGPMWPRAVVDGCRGHRAGRWGEPPGRGGALPQGTLVGAPCRWLAPIARRAVGDMQAAVTHDAWVDAALLVAAEGSAERTATGPLCAAYDEDDAGVGRDVVAAFLAQHLGTGRASRKVRIRG